MKIDIKENSILRYLGKTLFILNMLCIMLGILYIRVHNHSIIWNIFGSVLIITLLGNFLLVYIDNIVLVKNSKLIKAIKILGYVYLINNIFAMQGMMLGNFTLSNSYSNTIGENIYLYVTIYSSYFSIFILGITISYLNSMNLNFRDKWSESRIKEKSIFRSILKSLCYINLLLGIFFCWIILTRHDLRNFEIYTVEFSVFFAFIFLSTLIILLNLKAKERKTKSYYLVSVVGIVVVVVCALPLILTPYTISKAEESFFQAFGEDWRSKIDSNVNNCFLKSPFSIPAYFLGIESNDFLVRQDVMFYEGIDGNGKKVKLHFDAYTPKKLDKILPGEGSTVIRIHGGAWVAGDKGKLNVLQMNKYLAEQGYTVFDIQYGLSNNSSLTLELGEPEYVKGNFTIDDMIEHIGIFTKYIEKNAQEYKANLNSVFISGGSAGGHLATAVGLAINSGKYNDIFASKIKIKGIIPFYPANGLSKLGELSGNKNFVNPIYLVEKNSPPCLIYQGTRDSLVPRELSEELKGKYISKGNVGCAILKMPLGGHGSDYYFSGQYNQIFLYYMERFLYINK